MLIWRIAKDKKKQTPTMHITSIKEFERSAIDALFYDADLLRKVIEKHGKMDICTGKLMANVFYEPSTRTSSSFHAAMLRLGGNVMPITASSSSVTKGESLEDTIRTIQCYSDVIVLRHPQKGAADIAATAISLSGKHTPVINAGDGTGEHPTQALLDIYTIQRELSLHNSKIEGITVTMVGDMKHGRTVHSLANVLAKFKVKAINYVSPVCLKMPQEIIEQVSSINPGIIQTVYERMEEIIPVSDVIYMTRIQKERFF